MEQALPFTTPTYPPPPVAVSATYPLISENDNVSSDATTVDMPLIVAALRAHQARLRQDATTVDTLLANLTQAPRRLVELVSEVSLMTIPRWHFAMLNDQERCDAYSVALERRIRPGMHVLDIGTGGGLLALMAARAGAERVITCESNPLVAELARRIVVSAGMEKSVTVVSLPSHELVVGRDLDRRVDLIVSEIVDGGLIGEGLLPTMRHARANLLAPGGELMPDRCRVFGSIVSSPALMALNHVRFASGFDMRLFNLAATTGHFPVNLWTRPHELLSDPSELTTFHLSTDTLVDGCVEKPIPVTLDGQAHGLVVWFELDLGAGVHIRNAPDNHSSHWTQAFVPFPHAVRLTAGALATARLGWSDTRLSADISSPPPM